MKKLFICFFILFCGGVQAEESEYKTDFSVIDPHRPINPFYLECKNNKKEGDYYFKPIAHLLVSIESKIIAEYIDGSYKIYKKSKFTNWGATGEMYKNIEDKEFIGRKIDLNFQRLGLKQEVSWMRKKGSYVTSAESTFFYKCKKVKREHQLK